MVSLVNASFHPPAARPPSTTTAAQSVLPGEVPGSMRSFFSWDRCGRCSLRRERDGALKAGRKAGQRRSASGLRQKEERPTPSWLSYAMSKASITSTKAYQVAEQQMAVAREAANRKRAALLAVLFAVLFADNSTIGPFAAALATTRVPHPPLAVEPVASLLSSPRRRQTRSPTRACRPCSQPRARLRAASCAAPDEPGAAQISHDSRIWRMAMWNEHDAHRSCSRPVPP